MSQEVIRTPQKEEEALKQTLAELGVKPAGEEDKQLELPANLLVEKPQEEIVAVTRARLPKKLRMLLQPEAGIKLTAWNWPLSLPQLKQALREHPSRAIRWLGEQMRRVLKMRFYRRRGVQGESA